MISDDEKIMLRNLAEEVAELASRPIEMEKKQLWYDHNALKPTRPVVFCDPENGWNEIIRRDELLCCSDLARDWEWSLRRTIFRGSKLKDDSVITPFFDVRHIAKDSGWGLAERRYGGNDGGSFVWEAPVKSYDQLDLLRYPTITVDAAATQDLVEEARETFAGILQVRLRTSWYWTLGLTQTLANLRGLEQIMLDMIDEPEGLHRMMAFLRDGTIAQLKFLEQKGLLSLNNDDSYVGSGAFGWSIELPASEFDGQDQ